MLHLMFVQEVRDALGDVVKELGVAAEWHRIRAGTAAVLPRDCARVSLGGVKTFDPRGCNCMLGLSSVFLISTQALCLPKWRTNPADCSTESKKCNTG